MFREDFREDIAEVGGDGEIAPFKELFRRQTGLSAIDFATLDGTAGEKQATGVAVIRSSRTVLADSSAEFGHGEDDDMAHAVSKIAEFCHAFEDGTGKRRSAVARRWPSP